MTSHSNLGGAKDSVGGGSVLPSQSVQNTELAPPSAEADAIRRHICNILDFHYALVDVWQGDELVNLAVFTADNMPDEKDYALENLQDETRNLILVPGASLAQQVLRTMESWVGHAYLRKRGQGRVIGAAEFSLPYAIIPILESLDAERVVPKGVIRLVCLDPERKITNADLQTLKLVGQHLATKLPVLLAENQGKQVGLGAPLEELPMVAVVHANRVVRRRFSRCLTEQCKVVEADDAQRAEELLRAHPLDVVVVAAEMPGTGEEPFFAGIKQLAEGQLASVIVVVADDSPGSKADALNAGADDCVEPDCAEAELQARVRTLTRAKKTERELSMQLKLLEDYSRRLEEMSEKERKDIRDQKQYSDELELRNRELREKREHEARRAGQDQLLHKLSTIVRKSFDIHENVRLMLEELLGYFNLDVCFAILPTEDSEYPQDEIREEALSNAMYSLKAKDLDAAVLQYFQREVTDMDAAMFIDDVMRYRIPESLRKEVISHFHIYSLFYLPITYENKLLGLIGGHKCESAHTWTTDNKYFFRQIADQFASGLVTARLYRRVERQATTDGLTGLFNHRTGQEKLSEQLRVAERYQRNLCTVMLDVDHFKSINDTYGHPVGDTVLRSVAHLIKRDCRDVDIPVRYGGEEFLLILPEVNREGAAVVAERLRRTLSKETIVHEGVRLNVTASIGYACFPEDGESQKELLDVADKALYMSKRLGRNQVRGAHELNFQSYQGTTGAAPAAPVESKVKRPAPKVKLPEPKVAVDMGSFLQPEAIETIRQMAGALYAKSEYNKIHHLETAKFAEMVARVLGLSRREQEHIRVASLLHDVGLLQIPDELINKQGSITAEELRLLMQHPTMGAQMLKGFPALKEVCEILESHHECWDGTGYPRGLKGEEIPLAARIVSIVDAYHAMISDRPYRAAMSKNKARKLLKTNAGTQFDPFLVEIFISVLDEVEGT